MQGHLPSASPWRWVGKSTGQPTASGFCENSRVRQAPLLGRDAGELCSVRKGRGPELCLETVWFCEPMSPQLLKTKTPGRCSCCGPARSAGRLALPPEGAPLSTGTKARRGGSITQRTSTLRAATHPHAPLSAREQ